MHFIAIVHDPLYMQIKFIYKYTKSVFERNKYRFKYVISLLKHLLFL